MFIPARIILFFILYFALPFSQVQAQLDAPKRISISVPVASNNIERSAGLYLHVYAQEPRQSVSDFIEQEAGASEQALSELIAALKTDDFERYKAISVGSEKGKKNIFKSFYFTPTGDAVKDLEKSEMLYKLYLGDRIVYVLKVFLPKYNRHFALSLFFSRQNGNYYYESNNKPYPIKEAVSSAFFEQITLRSTSNYIFPYTPQPYNQTLVTGKYPVEAGFSNLWVVNQKLAAASPGAASKSNPEISKIVSFYQTVQQQLKADALDKVFQQMEPKSVERFTGNNTNINIPELAAYVLVMAVPDTIALIIDADPFYIVYGTNFT
ncbi:MAG: hypothetical protein GY770_01555, partial [Aestuariibacter sp.]|nr:hypothetical protein [Aestuariibacter sp.]